MKWAAGGAVWDVAATVRSEVNSKCACFVKSSCQEGGHRKQPATQLVERHKGGAADGSGRDVQAEGSRKGKQGRHGVSSAQTGRPLLPAGAILLTTALKAGRSKIFLRKGMRLQDK